MAAPCWRGLCTAWFPLVPSLFALVCAVCVRVLFGVFFFLELQAERVRLCWGGREAPRNERLLATPHRPRPRPPDAILCRGLFILLWLSAGRSNTSNTKTTAPLLHVCGVKSSGRRRACPAPWQLSIKHRHAGRQGVIRQHPLWLAAGIRIALKREVLFTLGKKKLYPKLLLRWSFSLHYNYKFSFACFFMLTSLTELSSFLWLKSPEINFLLINWWRFVQYWTDWNKH